MIILAVLYPLVKCSPGSLNEVGAIIGGEDVVIVEPEKWTGRILPLATFINGNTDYMIGRWNFVLYHEECQQCQELIRDILRRKGSGKTVFVEVPPYASSIRNDESGIIWRRLDDQHNWFVATPESLELVNGIVSRIYEKHQKVGGQSF